MLREELQNRLEVLRKEFEAGQVRLRDLEMQEVHLRETLLRISGAIQVLEELLQPDRSAPGPGGGPA
ncbi:MAG TPA: hypothetical protein VL334_20430 [Anaerolineae bacterium]|nr:hypothetical protein [Anaerolineae bacterium]